MACVYDQPLVNVLYEIAGESLLEVFFSYGSRQHKVLYMESGISFNKSGLLPSIREIFLIRIAFKNL